MMMMMPRSATQHTKQTRPNRIWFADTWIPDDADSFRSIKESCLTLRTNRQENLWLTNLKKVKQEVDVERVQVFNVKNFQSHSKASRHERSP